MIDKGYLHKDRKGDLFSRIQRGKHAFVRRYGEDPNSCDLHPEEIPAEQETLLGVRLNGNGSLRPGQYWFSVT